MEREREKLKRRATHDSEDEDEDGESSGGSRKRRMSIHRERTWDTRSESATTIADDTPYWLSVATGCLAGVSRTYDFRTIEIETLFSRPLTPLPETLHVSSIRGTNFRVRSEEEEAAIVAAIEQAKTVSETKQDDETECESIDGEDLAQPPRFNVSDLNVLVRRMLIAQFDTSSEVAGVRTPERISSSVNIDLTCSDDEERPGDAIKAEIEACKERILVARDCIARRTQQTRATEPVVGEYIEIDDSSSDSSRSPSVDEAARIDVDGTAVDEAMEDAERSRKYCAVRKSRIVPSLEAYSLSQRPTSPSASSSGSSLPASAPQAELRFPSPFDERTQAFMNAQRSPSEPVSVSVAVTLERESSGAEGGECAAGTSAQQGLTSVASSSSSASAARECMPAAPKQSRVRSFAPLRQPGRSHAVDQVGRE